MRIFITLASSSAFFNLYQTQAIYPWLATRYAVEISQAGWLSMASLFGMMLCAPFASKLTYKLPPRKTIIFGLYILITFNACIAISTTLETLFLIRFFQGIILPCILTSGMTIIGQAQCKERRTKWIGCYVTGTIMGSTLSRFYPAFAIDTMGWQWGFISCAGLLLLALLIMAHEKHVNTITATTNNDDEKIFYLTQLRHALSDKTLIMIYSIGFGILFTQSSVFTALGIALSYPPYSKTAGEIGLIYLACLPAIIAVITVPTMYTSKNETLLFIILLALLWGSMLLMTKNYYLVIFSVLLFSIATYLLQALTTAMLSQVRKVPVNFASGVYLFFYYGGGALGAICSATLYSAGGWAGVTIAIMMVHALILALLLWLTAAFNKKKPCTISH